MAQSLLSNEKSQTFMI